DMYADMEKVAEVVEETGIRASLSRGLIGVVPDADNKLQENIQLFKDWHGKADGRIQVMMGPHAPYTCPPEYLKKVIAAAGELGSEIHMHLSETKNEVSNCLKEYGLTPIALMDKLGMFEVGTLAAHCVNVTTDDIKIMAKKHVRVVHNPQSNLKLASGIAPIPAMLESGITVALGTDGVSSNNNLDMLEEARLAAFIHKNVTGDPTVIPATTALKMATVNGANAVGFKDLGELKVGQKADIVLYDMNKPYWYPRYDRTSLFIYAANASDADTVLVDGKVVLENGQFLTVDVEKVYAEANKCAVRLTK
ncbi:MAG: amidohydrolase, partial [Acidaminococcaceae bacterium]|nr:amidohydrolase [Acidaminococcaceae bacterium]